MRLSARAEPDKARPLGHARLIITGASAAALSGGYRIRREGYQASNLGLRGWQVSEEILRPVAILEEAGGTVLILGPRMTRNMEPGPVHLVLPGLDEVALFWPDSIEVFDGELPPDPIMPAEPPERLVNRAAPPEPAADATIIIRPPTPAPPPMPAPLPPASRKPPVALYAGGGLLLLLVAAGLAWWLLREPASEAPPPAPTPGPAVLAPTPPPSAVPAPPQPPAAIWPDGTDDLSPRDVVGRAADPAAILAVAHRRQQNARHDDALVLMEEAAARGHAPAMTALGRLYDPIGFSPGRPFRTPDPRAAARQYAEAERAGDAAATPLRAALRAWLQQQADGGNATAQSTIREFW